MGLYKIPAQRNPALHTSIPPEKPAAHNSKVPVFALEGAAPAAGAYNCGFVDHIFQEMLIHPTNLVSCAERFPERGFVRPLGLELDKSGHKPKYFRRGNSKRVTVASKLVSRNDSFCIRIVLLAYLPVCKNVFGF